MNEDTRLTAWEREKESFTCALCENDYDLTGLEIGIGDNVVCNVCANYITNSFSPLREKGEYMSQATVSIGIDKLEELIDLIFESIEPNVPHKRNPFEYCEEAHRVKEKLCDEMLKLLPCGLVEKVKREKGF